MKKQKRYFKIKTKQKKINRKPTFVFKLQGKLLARYGKEACDAFIASNLSNCARLENNCCIECERYLLPFRKNAEDILSLFTKNTLSVINREVQFDTSTVSGKRALRDYNEAQNAYMTRVLASDKEISSISEDMTAAHVVLDEAILALRNATTKKLNAFVSGVRSSYSADLENYRLGVDFSFSNSAKDSYFERHRETDTAIYARIK